jgi:flagellar biosynthesis GTPase FlhF
MAARAPRATKARAGTEVASPTMDSLLATKEIVVACGPGGVGKTTTAAASALMAAINHGSKAGADR